MWTTDPCLYSPLLDQSLYPLVPLERPDNTDFQTYFDNTQSGPYSQRPGQHVWTDSSMVTLENAQIVGAGMVGYVQDFIHLNFNVGGPATSQCGEMAAAARALDLADLTPLLLCTLTAWPFLMPYHYGNWATFSLVSRMRSIKTSFLICSATSDTGEHRRISFGRQPI
eukprot:3169103-Rhodomonas_salina.1